MIIALISAFACIVAITDAGGLRNEGETPAFHHLRSLNGGGVLCPGSKGKQEFGYTRRGLNRYFYAVMEAEDVDPASAPTFLYMAGGPGSSSLGTAMTSSGPCRMSPNGEELLNNTYSWTKQGNSIWIDAPGPTGFSLGPIETSLEEFINNMVIVSGQLFKKYPHLNRNVHLVGTSSSALFVAMLGEGILRNPQLKIDLRGVMLYSGVVGPYEIYHGAYEMAQKRTLLPQKESWFHNVRWSYNFLRLDTMKTSLKNCKTAVDKCNSNGPGKPAKPANCKNAIATCDAITMDPMGRINKSLYDVRARKGEDFVFYALIPGDATGFLNKPRVKQALGVSKTWKPLDYEVVRDFSKYSAYDGSFFVTQLLDHGLKVLAVNGDQDYITNAVGTTEWLFKLKGREGYGEALQHSRPQDIKYPGIGVVGTSRTSHYHNGAKLAFVEVKNAGHRIMLNQPRAMQEIFQSFLSDKLW
ncbi:Carboxypeptidase Y precursor, putative [Perkinsus marinus ATCC 50983]|uniref:Carboxypeptidase Y, putative n=1 Tax=Perkinsus marinus (strain ATCC 50983 / TXsc) TaxID=423536 RepID=C5L1N4_PERM5|nr:Carboxypeptidase Y precursor, putative [Perkinsus marinus ATCC 50983]EER09359.1 Carboxypeptidase Y precursor, putative [Perkinsus marinus ATCC 50983]|eukprot:XP_002777543.1 Carboxypeptidase Y precursor, putative [Perkinsus marinus ATCC 50983]